MDRKPRRQLKPLSIKANVALSTLYQILLVITPLATAPYISRVLGDDKIGIYSYTAAYQMYFSLFAALGTVTYGAREISRKRDNPSEYSKLFWEIELLTVMTSAICLVGWAIWIVFHETDRIYYIILTMSLLATTLDISWFYAGLEQFRCTVLQNSIFKILGVIALFIFVKKPDDLALYIGIMSASTLLANLSMWFYLPYFLVRVTGRLHFGHHFKETLVYFVPTVATTIYTVLDKTLIDLITKDAYQNGYYEQATKIINMTKAVTFTALNSVFGSRIAYLFEKKEYDEIRKRIEQSMSYILFMGVGIGFGIAGVASHFVPLFFGEGYEGVIALLYIFSPIVVIIGISNCLGTQFYTPAGLRRISARFIVIGACVNLCLNLILIPHFGCWGAAAASVVAELTITVLYMIFCRGYMTLKILWKHLWRNLIAGSLMFGLIWAEGHFISGNALAFAVQFVSGVALYCMVLIALRDPFLKETAIPMLRNKIHKRDSKKAEG